MKQLYFNPPFSMKGVMTKRPNGPKAQPWGATWVWQARKWPMPFWLTLSDLCLKPSSHPMLKGCGSGAPAGFAQHALRAALGGKGPGGGRGRAVGKKTEVEGTRRPKVDFAPTFAGKLWACTLSEAGPSQDDADMSLTLTRIRIEGQNRARCRTAQTHGNTRW